MNKSVVFHKIANNKETYQKNLLIWKNTTKSDF
jgi:hypothetical protein